MRQLGVMPVFGSKLNRKCDGVVAIVFLLALDIRNKLIGVELKQRCVEYVEMLVYATHISLLDGISIESYLLGIINVLIECKARCAIVAVTRFALNAIIGDGKRNASRMAIVGDILHVANRGFSPIVGRKGIAAVAIGC